MSDLTVLKTSEELSIWPTDDFERILMACDPGEALEPTDSRYVDLSELRSGIGVAKLQSALRQQVAEGKYHHCLLGGHRGSGKSTELLSLQAWALKNGYLAIWDQVDVRYGLDDLDYSDLFLLAATMVDEKIDARNRPLLVSKLRAIISWFNDITIEDENIKQSEIGIEVGGQLGGSLPLGLGSLFAKFVAGFKGTSKHSKKVRETVRSYPTDLIRLTKDFLETANEVVKNEGAPKGILLIFDNMDRYEPAQIDSILIKSGQQIRQMACHTVFTFPISLAYKPISGKVDFEPLVILPMFPVRKKNEDWKDTVDKTIFDEKMVESLRAMLSKRIALDKLFEAPSDVVRLIKMSGGSLRDLIQLIVLSVTSTYEGETITSKAVEMAIKELRGTYLRLLTTTPKDYLCLASYANRISIAASETDHSEAINRLLFNGCLLEYSEDGIPWYDIHPLLLETEEFRNAHAICK